MLTERILSTDNIMTASPNLPMSNASLKKSNNELVTALRHSSKEVNGTKQILKDDRSEYEITAKIFLLPNTQDQRKEYVADALKAVLDILESRTIDLLILSFPEIMLDAEDGDIFDDTELDRLVDIYNRAAAFVSAGTVESLGVAEFSAARLKQLCEHERVELWPQVDQINLKDCCVMPKDLILYAKSNDIKLFTHGDASDILPATTSKDILKTEQKPGWVCKYTAVAKSRGVIETKGYLVQVHD